MLVAPRLVVYVANYCKFLIYFQDLCFSAFLNDFFFNF